MAKRVFVKLSLLSFMLCLGMIQTPESLKAASNFPYPQNRNYSFGFKPNPVGASWAADAATILAKWNNWKAAHVTSSGAGGFLRVQRDSVDGNDTVSEGISYGMLIAVYVDDQATFNGLWQYKQIHNDGLGLMNWKISSGGSTIGANSAPDADQDIAYSLYLAHYQWGSGGAFNYKALADAELTKVAGFDLDSNRIKSGDVDNSCRYPSYFFPNEYRVFGIQSGNASMWNSVRANCYATIAAARNAATGLLAEQCTDTGLGGGCSVSSSQYQYNSARIPFRMALDYVYYGDANASGELSKLNSHFGAIAPGSVVDCYNLNGTTCGSFNGGAFVGPAATGFMYGGGANLQGYYTQLMAMNNDARYFDGSLQILSLLLLSGNMPNFGDQGSMFTPTYTCTVTPYAGTPTTTPTTTPVTFAYIFEDFENGLLSNHYEYSTTPPLAIPAVSTQGISATQKHGGAYSNRIQTKLPTASDYGGAGFDSSYAPASGVMNFTGSTAVRFWIYTDTAVSVRISFREGNGVAGGDNEVWQSALVPVLTTNAWVQVGPLLISSFTEDIYNTCNPNCLTLGNNTFNLSSVKAAQISFNPPIAATANVYVDDIAFIPSVAPTMTPTKTPFANPFNQIYDDFESPLSLFSGVPSRVTTYADTVNGASAAWALDAITTAQGARSGRLNYNIGTAASYGAGGGFISPYANASLYVDATGAVSLAMWMNAPAGLKYNLTIQEAGTPAAPLGGADGEAWNSALLTGTGGWTWVVVDLGDFVEDPYNIICNPTGIAAPGPCLSGAAAGHGIRDVQAIKQVGIKIPGGQTIPPASGAVYFDNVNFITTWKTPTPSRSPTPGANTPTFTPTPTPSPTASPSPSASPTASPSPSPTLTRSPTMTASPSASPTLSPTPTQASTLTASPGNTATFTASPSTTMTRTWTLTQTMSFSATNSPTPTNSPTITLSATPTRSPTASQTPSGTPTLTATRTATPSSTPNWTATPTPTNTPFNGSPTNTPTFTLTASPTPTYTRTLSHTSTWSPSSSATPSPSPTPSVTLTSSGTNSPTPTNTSLNTATATPTITWTFSVTNTPFGSFTFSPTVSGTPSNTPLATQTSTPTASPAASPSPTNTTSSTRSPTPAGTRSFTPSATPASSATTVISPTSTLTPPTDPWDPTDDSLSAGSTSLVILGITQTHGPHVLGYGTDSEDWFTSLLTGGNSYDLSALQSAGGTGLTLEVYDPFSTQLQIASGATAASLTFVAPYSGAFYFRVTSSQPLSYNFSHKELLPTLTPTPLSSSTATPTLSMTRTPTPGPTPVVTATPSYSSTAVAGTPLPTRDPNGPVLGVVAVPNPGLPQNVAVHLDRTVDKVELRLYSKAMVCVDQAQAGRSGPGWVLVPVPPAFLNNAAGTYYYAVSVESEGKKTRKNGVGQMVITK